MAAASSAQTARRRSLRLPAPVAKNDEWETRLTNSNFLPPASCLKAERRLFLGRQFFCCTRRRNMAPQSDRRKIGMELLAGERFFFDQRRPSANYGWQKPAPQ